ncbi:DUF3072 domain-containing protein [Mycolicibacterium sp. GCM10028919]|jgi:hypothetical protein|nr:MULTISPECIES: DUF3072 domain-containing protein [Mycolicibacterium]MBJ7383304.1 DUF3072 domain-containing protein [Mycolicibacterium sp.]MCV7374804.1 DUF3072 domain-containing protein [Mycolicibacterium arabiense]MDF2829889.1 hypothetical protein [Mycobacterium sp.]
MSEENTQAQQAPNENAEKDPSDWVTGDEPMTGAQRSYLHTLAQEAKREVPEDLTKAQASEMIDELQSSTGRG